MRGRNSLFRQHFLLFFYLYIIYKRNVKEETETIRINFVHTSFTFYAHQEIFFNFQYKFI